MKHGHRWLIGASMMVALAAALALLVPWGQASLAEGDIIHVDADAGGGGDGASWATAFKDLQDALEVAENGDQIWVAEGTYTPSVAVGGLGDRYKTFQMIDGVAIYGGFAGTESDLAERDWDAHETILSGDLAGNDGPNFADNEENSYHVFYHPDGTDLVGTAILDGFTISGGNASTGLYPHGLGGGMFNESSSPMLTNCNFKSNSAYDGGGGVYNRFDSSPAMANCTFEGNSAPYGGGMLNSGSSSPILSNCTFSGNSVTHSGGGMLNSDSSSPVLTNCTFSGNSAESGGGMYNSNSSSPALTDCTFSGNSADWMGGGMANISSSPELTRCTFADNAAEYGGGMTNENSSPDLTDCVFSSNSASFVGGAMWNYLSSPALTNCTFSGNTAINGGGGIWNIDSSSPVMTDCTFEGNSADFYGAGIVNAWSSPTLVNCTFSGNLAGSDGGGMWNQQSSPTLTNCTFSDNSAGSGGGGMYNYEDSSPTLTNSILWGDAPDEIFNEDPDSMPAISYTDIEDGCGSNNGNNCGEGNIDADPLFVNAVKGDLHLGPDSPCIDAGDNHAPDLPGFDFEGNDRILDGDDDGDPVVDMGVDEAFWYPIYLPVVLRGY